MASPSEVPSATGPSERAEQTFDGPALGVGDEGEAGSGVGGDDQPLAGLEALGGEAQGVASAARASAEPAGQHLGAATPVEAGIEREFMALCRGDAQVAAQADGEGDIVFTQEIGPSPAEKLPVGKQQPDAQYIEKPGEAAHQRDALVGAGVPPALDQRPHQRHPEAAGDRSEDEEVDLMAADPPLGPVEGQISRVAQPGEFGGDRRRPVPPQIAPGPNVLEEALQAVANRGDLGGAGALGGETAEVDGPRADHDDDDQRQRLDRLIAQIEMRA